LSAELTDLDFTSVALRPRPAAPVAAPRQAPPPVPREATPPAPREATPRPAREEAPRFEPRPEFEFGTLGPGHAGNLICYARSGVASSAAPDAPIVVVDDDESMRRLLEKVLGALGYPVRTAADSHEFMQLMRQPPLPRLILLDVELPKVNGFKILTALRQHPQTRGIPLAMLTARSESKDLLHALSLGADGYLSKPVSVAALRTTVERLLRKAA
jgi:CheY-like chemotaxis protein